MTAIINLSLFGAIIWCAAVIGWAAAGTQRDRPTRTGLDVLERRGDDDA